VSACPEKTRALPIRRVAPSIVSPSTGVPARTVSDVDVDVTETVPLLVNPLAVHEMARSRHWPVPDPWTRIASVPDRAAGGAGAFGIGSALVGSLTVGVDSDADGAGVLASCEALGLLA
jgi:hypothetical protein